MSLKSIEAKLRELGQGQDIEALQKFVTSLDDDRLCLLMSNKICQNDAPQLLFYIFRGLSKRGDTEAKRVKVTESVLKELQSRKLNSKQSTLILSRLALELDRFTPVHLVQFTEYCLNSIQDENSDHSSWKDLLPKLLSLLVNEDAIQHKGLEMKGREYKSQVIRSLIMLKWQPSTVISLAEMFIDVPMTNEEHLQVMNKFCETLNHMQPQEVPPLVHHLLQLCKNQHGVILFLRLQSYFSTKLYSKLLQGDTQADNDDDGIEADTDREVRFAAATVLFHVNQAASFGHASIKNLLKFLKSVNKAPELVLEPFIFTVLLSVSSISIYEEQVMDILRSAVHCSVMEGIRMSESAWLRTLSPSKCNIEVVLEILIDNSLGEGAYILEGLVKLAFTLMDTNPKGKEDAAEKIWSYGSFVLLRLMKKRREVATTVLQLISDRIITGTSVSQYTDCLHQMAVSVPHVLNDNRPIITQLVEILQQLPGPVAEQVVNAMLPIVKMFATFRDVLIMVLRKSLFSRNIETRKMAVLGFLQLLKNLDVSGMAVLSSQSQCSQTNSQRGQTILSQIDWEVNLGGNKNNEAVSLEVLGVLRRCFMQQSVVRLNLYKGLLSGVIRNPELSSCVQDMLLNHLNQYYVRDVNILPPLHFDKMVAIVNGEAVLQEPGGHLIFVIQQLATHSPCGDELKTVLDSLCDRMTKCSLEELGMSENRNQQDVSPEAQKQLETVQQVLGVLQALIGYCITSCDLASSQEKMQKLISLFKMYTKVADFLKNPGKGTKKADGDGNKAPKTNQDKKAATKAKAKFPDSVLDLQVCYRMLALLHGEASDWCKAEAASAVKGKREFHKFVLEVTLNLISSFHGSKIALKSKRRLMQYTDIARLLYKHCIIKYNDYSVQDKGNAALALDCFHEIFSQMISHCYDKLPQFLSDVATVSASEALPDQMLCVAKQFQQLLQDVTVQEEEEGDSDDDPAAKRIPSILLQTFKLVVVQLPSNEATSKVLSWVKEFLKEKVLTQAALIKEMVSLLFILEARFKVHSELYHNIAMNICKIIGIVEDGEEIESYIKYAVVREGQQTIILAQLCDAMKKIIDNIDCVIVRMKAEQIALSVSADSAVHTKREALKSKEREVVLQVSHCVRVLNYLSSLALEPGASCESVLKLLTQQYVCLSQITKHFITRSSQQNPAFQTAKFETVIKLVGKSLSGHVSSLISHIEANQLDESGKKKKKLDPSVLKVKVLRETRCIPRLVFEMEQFEKLVIDLSVKTKVNLASSMKPSTHRGFRINTMKLIASLDNNQEENDRDTSTEESRDTEAAASPRKRPRLQ